MTAIDYAEALTKIDNLDLSKNTKANLKSVLNRFNKNRVKTNDEIFKYLKKIEGDTKPSTFYSYLKTALSLMSNGVIPQSKDRGDMAMYLQKLKDIENKQRTAEPTEKQQQHYLSLPELQAKVKTIPDIDKRLLVSLYVDIPPVRLDYANIKIVPKQEDIPKEDDKQNYYALKQNTITLRDYKTKEHYGEQTYKLTGEQKKLIKESLKINPRDYLFTNKYGEPHSNNTFGKYLQQVFKEVYDKDISLLDLRHIYSSHYSIESYSKSKVNEVAKRMLHSSNVNIMEYQKNYTSHTIPADRLLKHRGK